MGQNAVGRRMTDFCVERGLCVGNISSIRIDIILPGGQERVNLMSIDISGVSEE